MAAGVHYNGQCQTVYIFHFKMPPASIFLRQEAAIFKLSKRAKNTAQPSQFKDDCRTASCPNRKLVVSNFGVEYIHSLTPPVYSTLF